LPREIQAFVTRDWPQVVPGRLPGYQAGFLVARRNPQVEQEILQVIRQGNYTGGFGRNSGWGGLGYCAFVGAMAMQGIMAYYYDVIRPNTAVELNQCRFMLIPTLIHVIPKKANVATMAISVKIVARRQWNKFTMCIIPNAANHGIVFRWDIREDIIPIEERHRPSIPMRVNWVRLIIVHIEVCVYAKCNATIMCGWMTQVLAYNNNNNHLLT
jgi:hypothetical protein